MTRPRERGNTGLWGGFRGGLTVTAHRRQSAARAAVPRPLRSGQQTDPKPPRSPSLNYVLLTDTAPPPLRPRRSHDPAAGEEYWRFPRGWAASGKARCRSLSRSNSPGRRIPAARAGAVAVAYSESLSRGPCARTLAQRTPPPQSFRAAAAYAGPAAYVRGTRHRRSHHQQV